MPLAATMEKLLVDSANGLYNFENGLPGEISIYKRDIELDRLIIQLQMLPDMIKTYNQNQQNIRIEKVTFISTLCEDMNSRSTNCSTFS